MIDMQKEVLQLIALQNCFIDRFKKDGDKEAVIYHEGKLSALMQVKELLDEKKAIEKMRKMQDDKQRQEHRSKGIFCCAGC